MGSGQQQYTFGEVLRGDFQIDPVTPEQRQHVRLLVASRSKSVDDCTLLLEALGLIPHSE